MTATWQLTLAIISYLQYRSIPHDFRIIQPLKPQLLPQQPLPVTDDVRTVERLALMTRRDHHHRGRRGLANRRTSMAESFAGALTLGQTTWDQTHLLTKTWCVRSATTLFEEARLEWFVLFEAGFRHPCFHYLTSSTDVKHTAPGACSLLVDSLKARSF